MRLAHVLLALAALAVACRSPLLRVTEVVPSGPDAFKVTAESDVSTDAARTIALEEAQAFAAERGLLARRVDSSQVVYLLDQDGPGGALPRFAYRYELVFRAAAEDEPELRLAPSTGDPPAP